MTRLSVKRNSIRLILLLVASGVASASSPAQDSWRTWSGEEVGVGNARFFAIDHRWYGIQVTCYKQSSSMDSSRVGLYYQGREMDNYKIAVNGNVYNGPITSEARVQSVEFSSFIDDIRTGEPITVIDGSASATIANRNAEILPDPFGDNPCFTFM